MSSPNAILSTKQEPKLKVTFKIHVTRRQRRCRLAEGEAPSPSQSAPVGRLPRVTRLLALAHHIQGMLDRGEVQSLAQVAELGHITRARVTQIMNLLLLAPDIQEEILFLPRITNGRDPITEHDLREVLRASSFDKQRRIWAKLRTDCFGSVRDYAASTGLQMSHPDHTEDID